MTLHLLHFHTSLFPAKFKPSPSPSWGCHPPLPRPRRWLRRRREPPGGEAAALASGDGVGGDVDAFTKYSGYLFEGGTSEADYLEAYDLQAIASIYRRKPFLVLRRLIQIGTTFGRWFGLRYLDRLTERSDDMFKIRATELRMILLELGPAYVKIAQAVSSRPDVIPPAYLEELSLLQDRIAPFSTGTAFNMIEEELGLPIDMLFSEISPEPIAAASLGQVYQARIIPSGQLVAVKVQRPGVQAAISLDIFILRFLAGLIRRTAKLNTDLQAVIDEWASSLFRVNHIECRRWTIEKKRGMDSSSGSFMGVCKMFSYQKCIWREVAVESLSWNGWKGRSYLK
uniref:Putative aarF domain-containing protein kinase At1g71810, chloroplastic n=1 Tax=Anthurium amnicola TaxID=1678845 RepID=A0A1D1Z8F3_9ARAE